LPFSAIKDTSVGILPSSRFLKEKERCIYHFTLPQAAEFLDLVERADCLIVSSGYFSNLIYAFFFCSYSEGT